MIKNPVVILGLQDTGLYAAQAIARYDIPIYGFDFNSKNSGFYSRFIKSYIGYHPYYEPDKLLKQVVEKAKELKSRPLLIISTESYLGFSAIFRKELDKYYSYVIPESEIIKSILNKSGQFKLAANCNIPVPEYFQITSKTDFERYLCKNGIVNVIIKALDQTTWKAKVDKKAFITKEYDELVKIGHSLLEKSIPFVIQDIIEGDCTNNFEFNALMIKGEIIECSVIQKLRQYPPGFGAACFVRTSQNPEVETLGRRFITQNKIEGFSNTEFKLNPDDGKYYYIETNARIWSQVRLTEYKGQNYLLEFYNRFADNPIVYKSNKRDISVKWVDIFSDFVLWSRFLRKKNIRFLGWLCSILSANNFGMLNLRDLGPFLHEIHKVFLLRLRKIMIRK
jgi:predicted ATP-grasp superfamily ATP-dependent carboligase